MLEENARNSLINALVLAYLSICTEDMQQWLILDIFRLVNSDIFRLVISDIFRLVISDIFRLVAKEIY